MRRFDARWQGENYEANVKAIGQLNEFAMTKGITVTHLALAWLLGQGEDIVAIPGTRNENRLAENVAATDGVLSGTETYSSDVAVRRVREHRAYAPVVDGEIRGRAIRVFVSAWTGIAPLQPALFADETSRAMAGYRFSWSAHASASRRRESFWERVLRKEDARRPGLWDCRGVFSRSWQRLNPRAPRTGGSGSEDAPGGDAG